jgi:alkylation response protein AidB-like acyl-CoA dehydrogenase
MHCILKIITYLCFVSTQLDNIIINLNQIVDSMDPHTHEQVLNGGGFIVAETAAANVFSPEDYTEEQLMVINMVTDFINNRVMPNTAKLESLDIDLTKQLIEEAGELGILGTAFPEEYGGYMQDFVTNMRLTELFSETRSFALSIGAHTGIGMLPILYFGTEAQKQQYLPSLIRGQRKAAYCLTEPGSGSDALSAKTKAVLSDDGKHYILNGQKMWITNAGFADVFVVFAKIDGEKFTGFIVERAWEGVSTAAEEKKLGIKGSSTRQVFFENVKVPVENVLGEIGKGHRIAFNILNIGRIKLAGGVLGGSKLIAKQAVQYANERKQFNKTLGEFGAIQYKLAEMAIKIYANESATYRASGDIERMEKTLLAQGKSLAEALLGAAEEYSIECALMKVHASECLDYTVDEGLQIYGGMGYSEEAPMASAYRDARINRIFEGTNEINRMLAVDMLLKRAMKGSVDLMTPAMAIQQELMSAPVAESNTYSGVFAAELAAIRDMKKGFIAVAGATIQRFMQALESEQEILMDLSDMMADVYIAESIVLRVQKLIERQGEAELATQIDMAKVFVSEAVDRLGMKGKSVIQAWAEGDMRKGLIMGLRRYTKYEGINVKDARRRIAVAMLQSNGYSF